MYGENRIEKSAKGKKKDGSGGNLSRADLEINTGEAFEVLFQQPLGIVLSDLLASH